MKIFVSLADFSFLLQSHKQNYKIPQSRRHKMFQETDPTDPATLQLSLFPSLWYSPTMCSLWLKCLWHVLFIVEASRRGRGRLEEQAPLGFGFLGLIEFSVMTINKTSAIIDCTVKNRRTIKAAINVAINVRWKISYDDSISHSIFSYILRLTSRQKAIKHSHKRQL